MKRYRTLIWIQIFLAAGASAMESDLPAAAAAPYQAGRVLLWAKDGFTPTIPALLPDITFAQLKSFDGWQVRPLAPGAGDKHGLHRSPSFLENLFVLTFPDTIDAAVVATRLCGHIDLVCAEPDFKLQSYAWPADSLFPHQWYLHNTGQEYYGIIRITGSDNDTLVLKQGMPGEDIRITPVYDAPPGDTAEVLVGIIDTGVDYEHPDLAEHVYHNPAEIPGDGEDNDHNGLVDDVVGWDFSGDEFSTFENIPDNDPADTIGHGTHLAGLVAAVQNDIGIAGYPGRIKILPVKIFPNALNSLGVSGIIYAADMGARVINLSWGFPFESNILHEALRYALRKGCLPVAAAGNFGDSRVVYPAGFAEILTVGGTDSDGFMTYFSSYGRHLDLSAPARDILSLRAAGTDLYYDSEPGLRIIADKYILADGTSMAAPLVAGAAAMIFSFAPALTADRVSQLLCESADDMVDPFNEGLSLPGFDSLSGWGRLNVGQALNLLLEPTLSLSAPRSDEVVSGPVVFSTSATGGYAGPAALYMGEGLNPTTWTLLYQSEAATAADTFYVWDSGDRNGYFAFRLTSEAGSDRVDIRVVNTVGAELTWPLDGQEVRYLAQIRGRAYGPDYDSVVIAYRTAVDVDFHRLFGGTEYFFDEVFYDWHLRDIPPGLVEIALTAYFDASAVGDTITVTLRDIMRSGFPLHLPTYLAFSPATADIDGDGRKEIVVGTQQGVYAYDADGDLLPGFPTAADHDMRSMPAFDDIDGDGLPDIIITGSNLFGCYNYRGEALPGWPKAASTGLAYFSYPIPVPTQLFDHGDSVIIYMSRVGEVRAYRFNGDSYFYSLDGLFTALDPNIFDTATFVGNSAPFVTAADLNADGVNEVVAAYSTMQTYSGIYIWNGRNGLPPFDWGSPLARKIGESTGAVLADVDEDGGLEIIVAGSDTLGIISIWVTRDGREDIAGWPVRLENLSGYQGSGSWLVGAPVCADLDGNGRKEIIVTFSNLDLGRLYAYNFDGTPFVPDPNLPAGCLLEVRNMLSNPIVADVDGNGLPNIVCRGGHFLGGFEEVFVWEPDGQTTPGFPIITPTPPNQVISSLFVPVADDIDGDGLTELIICGDDKDLFVWNLESPYLPDQMVWPKYLGDDKNSGINHHLGSPGASDPGTPPTPGHFAIESIYPNPFNPTTTIAFTLERTARVALVVYNILGQKVTTLADGAYPAGTHHCLWDGRDTAGRQAASGVYFARLTAEGRQATRKMVLVR